VGGLAASFVMNQFQWLLVKMAGDQPQTESTGDDATVKTAQAVAKHIPGRQLTPEEKAWAGPLVHYSFGALLGAVYGLLAATVPKSGAGSGIAFGTAVWLVADEIFVPVFGLSGSPVKSPASTHVKALASHLVYGATTDLTRKLILKVAAKQ
jgi:ABC-type uncharacterized transport system permease subunit